MAESGASRFCGERRDIASDEPPDGKYPLPASSVNWRALPSPCYVVDEGLLVRNLEKLRLVASEAGCKILLAQKAFSMYAIYPLVAEFLDGAAASSLFEAKLAREEMGREVHIYSPAYRESEFSEILKACDHIVFNSFAQWKKFAPLVMDAERAPEARHISCGIRANPEYSEIETEIYNPCARYSRLGSTADEFAKNASGCFGAEIPGGVEGLHFHAMCEQGADTLERTLAVFEEKFEPWISSVKWVNFGGGHHITRDGYDIPLLVSLIRRFREKYGVEVYLEPGEAVALNAGFLVSTVLDVIHNGIDIAIMDVSAACHMPDVLEMPYRPHVLGSAIPNSDPAYPRIYRLGGPTCLAGDVTGDYAFTRELLPGDRLVFCDMAIYTMVKNNTFNGIGLPSIILRKRNGEDHIVRGFSYEDFKNRLS